MALSPERTDTLLAASSIGLAGGAIVLGSASPLSLFAAIPCGLFGAAMVAWRRDPSPSMAALVLLAAGFVRILFGPIGLAALLLVPLVARRADPEHAKHLIGAAVGVHLAVFASNQLASALEEPFPTLATLSPGEAIAGLALFVPFTLLVDPGGPSTPAPDDVDDPSR